MSARRARLSRAVAWAAIPLCILAPLLALGLLAQVTLTYRQHLVHTGDALTDSYLQALVDNDLVANESAQRQPFSANHNTPEDQRQLPERLWRSMEQRFSADPRFWLLCYNLRPACQSFISPVAGVEVPGKVRYLEEARQRGMTDWRILYWLSREYGAAWEEAAASSLNLVYPGYKNTLDQNYSYSTQRNAEVIRRHGAARRELFAALAQAGADQAQAQYELAFRTFEDGDLPSARSYMAAGNAAAHNSAGFSPPYDALITAAAQGQPLAGDRLLTGRMLQESYELPTPEPYKILRMVLFLARWAAKSDDGAALSILHHFNCRFGSAPGASHDQTVVAVGCEVRLLKAYRKTHLQLSTEQAKRCADFEYELGTFQSSIHGLPPAYVSLPPSRSEGWLGYWEDIRAASDGGRAAVVENLELSCRELLARQRAIAKVQARLEHFAPPLPWE